MQGYQCRYGATPAAPAAEPGPEALVLLSLDSTWLEDLCGLLMSRQISDTLPTVAFPETIFLTRTGFAAREILKFYCAVSDIRNCNNCWSRSLLGLKKNVCFTWTQNEKKLSAQVVLFASGIGTCVQILFAWHSEGWCLFNSLQTS